MSSRYERGLTLMECDLHDYRMADGSCSCRKPDNQRLRLARGQMIPVLSVRLPWAWLLVNGPKLGVAWKDVENRTWKTNYRGPIFIHASRTCRRADWEAAAIFIAGCLDDEAVTRIGQMMPVFEQIRNFAGHVIGAVNLVDCVTRSESAWFTGDVGFVMTSRIRFQLPVQLKCPTPRIFTPTERNVGGREYEALWAICYDLSRVES